MTQTVPYILLRKTICRRVLLLLVFFLCFAPGPGRGFAAASGPENETPAGIVQVFSNLAGGRIGDPIPFTLKIKLAPGVDLDDGSLAGLEVRPDRLPPELYSSTLAPFSRRQAVGKKELNLRGTLRLYAPGTFRIEPTRLVGRRRDAGGKTRLYDLVASALTVKVAALQPAIATSRVSLVVPRNSPPLPPRPATHAGRVAAASYLGILFLLAALFCGLGVYLALRAPKTEPAAEKPAPETPRESLAKLLAGETGPRDWRRLVAIDHRLRSLLGQEFSPAPARGGRGEAFARRLADKLPPAAASSTRTSSR